MFLLNNNPLGLDTAFTHNEIKYPANWLRLATPEERIAIGITEVPDPEVYDDRYYWGVGIPKDLDQCKTMIIMQIKQTAAALLMQSSWMIERANDPSSMKPVPQDVLDYRALVRSTSNSFEASVSGCTTVDELASLQFSWPQYTI